MIVNRQQQELFVSYVANTVKHLPFAVYLQWCVVWALWGCAPSTWI